VVQYNTERPHQSLGMRPRAERFALRRAGVQRWVDQRGSIRLAREPVQRWSPNNLVQIYPAQHRAVLRSCAITQRPHVEQV
jgi:hypothetical protein